MGKQVIFFANNEDLNSLLELAEASGLLAIPQIVPTGSEILPLAPKEFRFDPKQLFYYLVPEKVPSTDIISVPVKKDLSYSKISSIQSPVIEIQPCRFENNQVGPPGRFYIDDIEGNIYFEIVLKGYNKLASRVKKWRKTKTYNFFVGPDTSRLAQDGEIRLMYYKLEMKVA